MMNHAEVIRGALRKLSRNEDADERPGSTELAGDAFESLDALTRELAEAKAGWDASEARFDADLEVGRADLEAKVDALTREAEEAKAACPVCTDFERRYENLLQVHGKIVAENATQAERIAKLEKVLENVIKRGNVYGACPYGNHLKMPWELWNQMVAALAPKEAQG